MPVKTQQLLLVGLTGLVIVLLLLMPKQPASKREVEEVVVPGSADAKIERALALMEMGKSPMEGIMLFREVLDEDSMNVKAHFYLGQFSLQSGQMDKAIMRFEKVISIDSMHVDAFWELATLRFEQGEYGLALPLLEKVAVLEPEFVMSGLFIGKCYQELGQREEALEKYKAYLPHATDSISKGVVQKLISELEN